MTAVEYAKSKIGVEEVPRGSNWGPEVKMFLASIGIPFPASWCLAFVYWCFQQAAEGSSFANPMMKTGSVMQQWDTIDPMFKVAADAPVLPGDIFIQDHGHGTGHTGIVEKVEGAVLHTIEGNTNDTGSREGYEVCRKIRAAASMMGYIRIPELTT